MDFICAFCRGVGGAHEAVCMRSAWMTVPEPVRIRDYNGRAAADGAPVKKKRVVE